MHMIFMNFLWNVSMKIKKLLDKSHIEKKPHEKIGSLKINGCINIHMICFRPNGMLQTKKNDVHVLNV